MALQCDADPGITVRGAAALLLPAAAVDGGWEMVVRPMMAMPAGCELGLGTPPGVKTCAADQLAGGGAERPVKTCAATGARRL